MPAPVTVCRYRARTAAPVTGPPALFSPGSDAPLDPVVPAGALRAVVVFGRGRGHRCQGDGDRRDQHRDEMTMTCAHDLSLLKGCGFRWDRHARLRRRP